MALDDKLRWDERYKDSPDIDAPSSFLRRSLESDSWPARAGIALDIACGKGRNALYLARRGFHVDALDISSIALEHGKRRAQQERLAVDWQQADLEAFTLPIERYDLIVIFNYLQRSLIESVKTAVKPGGAIIFETYLIDQAAIGQPKNPDHLLQHNELLDWFRNFRVLDYREGMRREDGNVSFRASIFALRLDAAGKSGT